MTRSLFVPDTTVLTNFALIGRMDLLATIVADNGAWCATVAGETSAGACRPGLSAMADASIIFGDPLFPTTSEHVDIRALQAQMLRPGDDRYRAHLGEAETITIISSRRLRAAFVTDDHDAARHASRFGIPTYTTWHIMKLAVGANLCSIDEFTAAYSALVAANRGHPPCATDIGSVMRWVGKPAAVH